MFVCVSAQSLQLCPTLCDPMDCSLPGSSVHGILHGVGWSALLQGNLPDPGIEPTAPPQLLDPSCIWGQVLPANVLSPDGVILN